MMQQINYREKLKQCSSLTIRYGYTMRKCNKFSDSQSPSGPTSVFTSSTCIGAGDMLINRDCTHRPPARADGLTDSLY